MLPILFALAVVPPPIITPTAPPAPPAPSQYTGLAEREAMRPETLELRVATDEGLLWQGPLRVGLNGAAISQERREAVAEQCIGQSGYSAGLQTNFSVSVSRLFRTGSGRAMSYSVSVRWTRPGSGDGCATLGSRTVQLEQKVELEPGRETILRGDAGLTVTIRRR
jgi:hypothetical protein